MRVFGVRWRLYRAADPKRGVRSALALFAIFVAAVVTDVLWSRVAGGTTFWAANGVLAAGILLLPWRLGLPFVAACVAVNAGLNVAVELPLQSNISFTSLNVAFSALVAVLVRTFCGAAMDLGRLRRFLPFVGLVAVAAAIEGAIGASFTANNLAEFVTFARRWAMCDGSGMILGLPATLMVMRRVNPLYAGRAGQMERLALLAGLGAVTWLLFSWSGAPTFVAIYPLVLFAAFRLGSAGAFLAAWVVVQAATIQTIANNGPIAVYDGEPPFLEVGLLQIFLLSVVLTTSLATSALAERMRAEQRLRRREAASAAARARAEQMARTRERFLAVVSHEIRTPLNGIIGFTGALAARPELEPEARRQVEMIGRSTDSLATIVEDILDFSRLENNRFELEPQPSRLSDLLVQAVDALRPAAEAKGLTLRLDYAEPAAELHAVDARRLRRVLGSLIDNAVKFTDSGGVEIRAALGSVDGARDRLQVEVIDTGPGVPAARRGELFQAFGQLDASLSRQHAGMGLGLAICRSLVELMDGEIAYAPGETGGSVFRFSVTLPKAGPAPAEAEPIEAETDDDGRAPRILVVDDHPVNREVARLILTACGCEVAEAADGAEAVEAVKTAPFDAVLMDVRMPGMDGLAATRAIRLLDSAAAQTPILAVTADVMRDDVERCREAGMNGHVPKPINQAGLMTALMAALEGADGFHQARAA